MIKEETFTLKRIRDFRNQKEFNKIDVIILEKMIFAFYLLEVLKTEGLDFIFKGGTSLNLLFSQPKRFSIDVDILTNHSREEIEKVLGAICKNHNFIRYELDKNRSYQQGGVPKAHYYLYFNSAIEQKESQIMLDILLDANFYPKTVEVPLKSNFLILDEHETKILIPTINAITGDKITAFAPNSTGYLYGKGLELQIVKQLFDLGHLFEYLDDYSEFSKSFNSKIERLKHYFNNQWTKEQILDDIISTSLLLAKDKKIIEEKNVSSYNELCSGIKQISNFLIVRPFHLDMAIESAAKVALLAAKLKTENYNPIEPFDKEKGMNSYLIDEEEYNFLNKLKKKPSLALFYFNQMIKALHR